MNLNQCVVERVLVCSEPRVVGLQALAGACYCVMLLGNVTDFNVILSLRITYLDQTSYLYQIV